MQTVQLFQNITVVNICIMLQCVRHELNYQYVDTVVLGKSFNLILFYQ